MTSTKLVKKKIINVEVEHGVFYDTKTGNKIDPKKLKSHNKTHEYRLINVGDELATGMVVNQYKKNAISFLSDLDNYNAKASDIHAQIDIANKMFRNEDVVSTGVEVLVDFTISGFEFTGIGEKIKPLIDYFEKSVNQKKDEFSSYGMLPLLQEMAYEYFISGNIFPAERWEKTDIDGKEYLMPVEIKLMNPANIALDENNLFGDRKIFFTFGSSSRTSSSLTTEDLLGDNIKNLTGNPLFENTIIEKDILGQGSMIEIKRDIISHLKRKSRDYDVWGVPYLTKLAQAVTYKQKLWQLDLNTIDGLLNFVTIFKIGSPDKDSVFHNPPKARLDAFKNLINNPQASTLLVWPHDIEVITAGPDGKVLSFADKYKEANRAIIQGLGVPPILIDGTGTATAGFVTILALNKRLDLVRQILKKYIEYILIKIASKNDLLDELTGKEELVWFPSDLRNEAQIKQLLLAFYDRGLLPIRTTHNQGGYRHEDMVELKLEDEEQGLEELFERPNIPFSPNTQDQTPGRPSDTTKTDVKQEDDEKKEKLDGIKFAYSTDLIAQQYELNIHTLFDTLEENVMGLKKKAKSNMNDLLLIAFVRMQQIADTFTNFKERSVASEFSKDLDLFHTNAINKLHEYVRSNLAKSINIHREFKDLFISGIFAKAKKRATMFVDASLRNMELMQSLIRNKEEGNSGAIVNTPADTECQFCKEINGEFFTLSMISQQLPSHVHQRFTLQFIKENPVQSGKKQNKVIVKDKQRRNKKL